MFEILLPAAILVGVVGTIAKIPVYWTVDKTQEIYYAYKGTKKSPKSHYFISRALSLQGRSHRFKSCSAHKGFSEIYPAKIQKTAQ